MEEAKHEYLVRVKRKLFMALTLYERPVRHWYMCICLVCLKQTLCMGLTSNRNQNCNDCRGCGD